MWKNIKVCGYTDLFQKLNQRSLTPRWPLTPSLLRSHVWFYPSINVSKSHENTSKYVDTVTLFKNLSQRSLTPRWHFDPMSVEVTCVTLPNDHCVQIPRKYITVCGYSDPFFFKNLNQRSLTPRWPLTPCLLRSHLWLYPRIIVSKSHGNTSMYVYTVVNFVKLPHTTYILYTTYYVQNEWSPKNRTPSHKILFCISGSSLWGCVCGCLMSAAIAPQQLLEYPIG